MPRVIVLFHLSATCASPRESSVSTSAIHSIVLPPELTYHHTLSESWGGSAQGFCSKPVLIVTLQTNALTQRWATRLTTWSWIVPIPCSRRVRLMAAPLYEHPLVAPQVSHFKQVSL